MKRKKIKYRRNRNSALKGGTHDFAGIEMITLVYK
jgi:hypothetical protein